MRTAACSVMLAMCLVAIATPDDAATPPPSIKPEEARAYEGKVVEVIMEVKASKNNPQHKKIFLDSEADFHDEKNLGIFISEKVAGEFKLSKNIDDPAAHYKDKTIRVKGKIVIRDDRAYIDLADPSQIVIIEKDKKSIEAK